MENENLKCYACGAVCSDGGFTITYGVLGSNVGLCRECVKKGISVSVPQGEPLKSKPITEEKFNESCLKFSDGLNKFLNAITQVELSSGYWEAAVSLGRMFQYKYKLIESTNEVVADE